MAGINRLGKAPPKPGTLRPPDPNKYRTVDMFSEGAEADMDYQKTVRDIEEMQQQQGWLFGRGAFDKADLLYLRDTAEQQRHMELELRDSERNQFAALRARLDHQQQDARPSTSRPKRDREDASASKPLPKVVPKVLPKQGHAGRQNTPAAERIASEPPDKRSKHLPVDGATTSLPALHNTIHGLEKTKPSAEPAVSNDESDDAGILGLLGGYGSDSADGTSDANDDSDANSGQPGKHGGESSSQQHSDKSSSDSDSSGGGNDDDNDSDDSTRKANDTVSQARRDGDHNSTSGLPSAAELLGD